MKQTFKATVELDVEVVGHYTGATPGRLSGPPEDCYPGDPEEFEIEAVLLNVGGEQYKTIIDILGALSEEDLAALREQGCEEVRERLEADYEDQMVASAEARRDADEDR